ncbi:MAG: hypothetical protein GX214_01825 [Clostridiales bacterium]|nr:hypothetical protein [Clostridiales bacterium]
MFQNNDNKSHISKNLKAIDFLKCELLNTLALLFETMTKGIRNSQELILECLTNILLATYTLGRRLGFDYNTMDKNLAEKIKIGILEEHHLEKWYGDLTDLKEHLNDRSKL